MSCNCSYKDWRGESEWKRKVYGTTTEEGMARGREEGRREEGREGRKEGRGILCSTEKNTNFQYLHTNARILPNKHLTETANTMRRHQTRHHIQTTLNTHLFVYSLTI